MQFLDNMHSWQDGAKKPVVHDLNAPVWSTASGWVDPPALLVQPPSWLLSFYLSSP